MDNQQLTNAEAKAGCIGSLAGLVGLLVFGGWLIWPLLYPDKPLEQRRRELQEFTDRRAAEEATRHRNEIIYDELLREAVRQSTP